MFYSSTFDKNKMIYHIVAEKEFLHQAHNKHYLPINFQDFGFVHCALEPSVLSVANDFYSNLQDTLLLLRIDPNLLTSETKYEAAAPVQEAGQEYLATSTTFPHVYGPIDSIAIDGIGILAGGTNGYQWPERFVTLAEYIKVHPSSEKK